MEALTFKITIPDGDLKEYLKGKSARARNFELLRLASNQLINESSTNSGRHEVDPVLEKVNTKEILTETSPTDTKDSKQNIATVDFGDDILSLAN